MRLLSTLYDLVLDDHKAALELWIDVDENGNANIEILDAAQSFNWKMGATRVRVQSRNAGMIYVFDRGLFNGDTLNSVSC